MAGSLPPGWDIAVWQDPDGYSLKLTRPNGLTASISMRANTDLGRIVSQLQRDLASSAPIKAGVT